MNCLAHAFRFLDDPHFAVGTCLPDWLGMVDRKVRLRQSHVDAFAMESTVDTGVHSIVDGIRQHMRDDLLFHGSASFAVTSLEITKLVPIGDDDTGHRRSFVGHVLTELLLDASIEAHEPGTLHRYYQRMESVCPNLVEKTVNGLTQNSTDQLVPFMKRYVEERFLFDYLTDRGMLLRLNGLLRRVRLKPFPLAFVDVIEVARQLVNTQRVHLLEPVQEIPK
jgi:hypothetical protein